MKFSLLIIKFVLLLSTGLVLLTGCPNPGSGGAEGNMTFCEHDSLIGVDWLLQGIDRPVALNSQRRALVVLGTPALNRCSVGEPADLVDAFSSDTAVFEVIDITDNSVIFEARGQGSARLNVESVSGLTDSFGFDIYPVDRASVFVTNNSSFSEHHARQSDDETPLNELVVLPGSAVSVGVTRFNANGQRLVGTGDVQWNVDGDIADILTLTEADSTLFVSVAVDSQAQPSRHTLDTNYDSPLTLEVGDVNAIETLALQHQNGEYDIYFGDDVITLQRTESITYFELAAFDDQGRAIHGRVIDSVEMTVVAGNADVVGGEIQELSFQTDSRLIQIPVETRGEVRLQFQWLDHSIEVGLAVQ